MEGGLERGTGSGTNERGATKSGNQDTTYLDSKEGDRIERVKKDGNYPTVLCVYLASDLLTVSVRESESDDEVDE